MKRVLAIAVLATTTLVFAGGDPSAPVRAVPEVRVIHVAGAGGATGTVALTNSGSTDVTITSLARAPSCDPDVTAQLATPTTIPAGGAATVSITCAGTITTGMKRCVFRAAPSVGTSAIDFEAVCEGGAATMLGAAPTSVDFGEVAIGATATTSITVTSAGPATVAKLALQTTDLDGTFELGAPCNPDARECDGSVTGIASGGTTVITVGCRPKRVGVHAAQLHIATETGTYLGTPITLTCEGTPASGPVLAVTGEPVNAGSVEVMAGMANPPPVHLRNAGTSSLTVFSAQILGGGSAWSYLASGACTGTLQQCILGPGEEVDLELHFDPSVIGARGAALVIGYFDGVARSRVIPLVGTGTGATLAVVGPVRPLDFGSVPLNVTSNLAFALGNLGNRSTTATLTATPAGSPFTLSSSMIGVAPGTPSMVGLACRPTVVGEASTTVHVAADDAVIATSIDLGARCTGTAGPLYSDPTAVALGEIRTNAGPITVPLEIQSTGATLQISSAALATMNANLAVAPLVPASTPAPVVLEVDPQTAGPVSDELVVTAASGATVRIPVTGTVVTAAYQEPVARSLGTFCVNQPTTPEELELRSTGTATIMLGVPRLAADVLSPFDLELRAPTVYPSLLPAGSVATVGITPKRSMVAGAMPVQDEIVWTTDVEGKETARTAVSAQFVDDGGAIAPSALSFGAAVIHIDTFNAQRVTLQNCDTQTLFFVTPDVPPPFRIDSAFPLQLGPNESATFSVGFHPTRRGVYTATLRIESDQLPTALELELDGEGVIDTPTSPDGGVDPPGVDERSFYGCGCASTRPDGSALLILLALGLSGRRRSGSS